MKIFLFEVDKSNQFYIIIIIATRKLFQEGRMEVRDLKIGTRLELEILDGDGKKIGNTYVSQVLEPVKDRTLIISAPIYESRLIYVPMNGKVRITFFHSRYGLQGFNAVVTAREQKENLSILCVQAETEPDKIQRRTHYRLDCTLDAEYGIYSDNPEKETDQSHYKHALTKNISGSGACIVVREDIAKNTLLDVRISFSETVKIGAVCRVIRCTPLETEKISRYEIRLQFTDITAQDQDYIIKYIFEEQRRLLKKKVL